MERADVTLKELQKIEDYKWEVDIEYEMKRDLYEK